MKQKKKAALAAALWLAVSANGQAAEAQEETFALDEVVITASKTKQDVKDSPSAVQVITRKTMDEQGAQTLKDVAALCGGSQFSAHKCFADSRRDLDPRL